MNKKLFLLPIMAIVLILGGCSNSNRIDTSSLVQTITAENKSGKVVYNFYLLENSEDVQGVSVEADSLEKAVISAKKAYIPALTLSKLELYLIDSNLGEKTLKNMIWPWDPLQTTNYTQPSVYTNKVLLQLMRQ